MLINKIYPPTPQKLIGMVCECRGQIRKYENKSPRSEETVSPVLHPKERAARPYEVRHAGTQRERGTKGPICYCLSIFFSQTVSAL